MPTIHIIIADEHDMVRRALHILLSTSDSFEIIGEIANLNQVESICHDLQPDVILLEPFNRYVDLNHAEAQIRQLTKMCTVVILSTYGEQRHVLCAERAGARSYMEKNVTSDILIETLHKTVAGESVYPPRPAVQY